MMKKIILLSVVFVLLAGVSSVLAIPALQLYIEGSTYDTTTETWLTDSSSFTLWVLGNVDSVGTIEDVRLAFAYDGTETGSITFTPTTTSLLSSVYSTNYPSVSGDPSTPDDPDPFSSGSGGSPVIGVKVNPANGKQTNVYLPSHGIYGPGVDWEVYKLGNFASTDSPIGNYAPGNCPDGACSYPTSGQINAYKIDISGYTWVHFDAYGYDGPVAPFSHDAATPEPATMLLLGSGLLGLAGLRRIKRRV